MSVARNGRPGGKVERCMADGRRQRTVRRLRLDLAHAWSRGDRLGNADVFLRDMPPVPRLNPATIDFGSRAVGVDRRPGRRDARQHRLGAA